VVCGLRYAVCALGLPNLRQKYKFPIIYLQTHEGAKARKHEKNLPTFLLRSLRKIFAPFAVNKIVFLKQFEF
jgi:hypothetical protein